MNIYRTLWFAVGLAACESPASSTEPSSAVEEPTTPRAKAADAPAQAGPIPEGWVRKRVESAEQRLGATAAGALVWQAIEAHGGLARWLSFGTVEFEFDYQPVDNADRRMHTFNRADLWRARAHQRELGEGADATLGFDGEQAWIVPSPEAFPSPARFWATTPYYFVGIPWVFADPGTHLTRLEDAELDGTRYHLVKVEYESGTGDAPDDFYVLYLHPETHRVDAIRYIVSYAGFFPEGGHSPEKVMRYLDQRDVQGLRVAHRYETYLFAADANGPAGEKVTDTKITRVRFGESYPASLFASPSDAVVSELPQR